MASCNNSNNLNTIENKLSTKYICKTGNLELSPLCLIFMSLRCCAAAWWVCMCVSVCWPAKIKKKSVRNTFHKSSLRLSTTAMVFVGYFLFLFCCFNLYSLFLSAPLDLYGLHTVFRYFFSLLILHRTFTSHIWCVPIECWILCSDAKLSIAFWRNDNFV